MPQPTGIALNVPTMGGGGIANTVAPSITATAVIGTEIAGDDGTWTGSPTLTYQWQRYATGAWGNIAGATNKNYTPVDADFGAALRLGVIPNGLAASAAYSNATNLTQEAPVQALGAELATNADFSAWTADDPDGWTVSESGGDIVTQNPAGVAQFITTGALVQVYQSSAAIEAQWVHCMFVVANATTGNLAGYGVGSTVAQLINLNVVGTYYAINPATNPAYMGAKRASLGVPANISIDSVSYKVITPNTQLVAPLANMRLDGFYTLPGSPGIGTVMRVFPRVSDFSLGNYWVVELGYTGSQWDVTLYSVATFTRTSRVTAANVGVTNGIRVNMNGDQISLYTTANGGTNWTQRGSTITNSTYQTAVGVNALWTDDITPGTLVYAPAD